MTAMRQLIFCCVSYF